MQSFPFELTLFTNDAAVAARADRAGIDRIGPDLDRLGKTERQGPQFRISNHSPADLDRIRGAVVRGRVFARTDPLHDGTRAQVDELIARGAEVLMLPMFRRPDEAARFVDIVRGRARVSLLVETAPAAVRIRDVVRVAGVDEIFVGLNDLHLSLGLDSRFELLTSGLMDEIAGTVQQAGLRFGVGGLGRASDDTLPVPSSLVYPQYARLGARGAIVARSFLTQGSGDVDLAAEVNEAKVTLDRWQNAAPSEWQAARESLRSFLSNRTAAAAA
jgi:hypothetical protein